MDNTTKNPEAITEQQPAVSPAPVEKAAEVTEKEPVDKTSEPSTSPSAEDLTKKTAEEKEREASYLGEDRMERHSLPFKQRLEANRKILEANMEGMDKKERFHYLAYYYKWHVILSIIAMLVLGIFIHEQIDALKPRALYIDIVNCNLGATLDDTMLQEYYNTHFTRKYKMSITTSDMLGIEHNKNYPNGSSYSTFPVACAANMYDVIIIDRDGLDWCAQNSSIHAPETILSTELLDVASNDFVRSKDANGDLVDAAIDISDTEFARSLNLPYQEIFICFPGNTEENIQNAEKLLKYIYGLE